MTEDPEFVKLSVEYRWTSRSSEGIAELIKFRESPQGGSWNLFKHTELYKVTSTRLVEGLAESVTVEILNPTTPKDYELGFLAAGLDDTWQPQGVEHTTFLEFRRKK